MPQIYNKPIRMCISCRGRFSQNILLRLRCTDKILQNFKGSGRSFYLCKKCLEDEKKIIKSLMRQCKIGDFKSLSNQLKEIVAHNGKS